MFRTTARSWRLILVLFGAVLTTGLLAGCPQRSDAPSPNSPEQPDGGPPAANQDPSPPSPNPEPGPTDPPAPPPEPNPNPNAVSRVVVTPGTLLLTAAGETLQLTAVPLDAAGNPTAAAAIAWQSSDPNVITVSPEGQVTAISNLGSAKITAQVDGMTSAPVLAVLAQPAAGATLVADAQVVGQPAPVDEAAKYGLGYRYRVTLQGVPAPAVGSLLVGTGEKPVGGRVVEVVQDGEKVAVTLEVVGLDELFQSLRINESFDLKQAQLAVPPEIAAEYEVTQDGDGTLHFTPWPADPKAKSRSLEHEFDFGPFECTATLDNPLVLEIPPVFSVTLDSSIDFAYDSAAGGFQRLVLVGEPKISLAFSPRITAGFNGSLDCNVELAKLKVPLGGPLSLIIAPLIGIEAGFELSGSVTLAEVGFDASAELGIKAQIGVDCAPICHMVNKLECKPKVELKPVLPSTENVSDNFELSFAFQPYAAVVLFVSNPFFDWPRFEAFEIKLGPKLELELASPQAQADDPNSASGFKLTLAGEAGMGNSVDKLMEFIKVSFVELKVELEVPLDASPTGTFTITPNAVKPGNAQGLGELVTFTTTLNQSTFLGLQAVEGIEYYWMKDGHLEPGRPLCNALEAAFGQTVFECETDFLEEHRGEQKFYAFCKARLFGVPLPFPLEVDKNSEAKVKVEVPEFAGLGFLPGASQPNSQASAVSADGRVVVGFSRKADGHHEAFRWVDGTMTGLGFLPGDGYSQASAVSADGNVVVGWSYNNAGRTEAFRWSGGTMTGLGLLPGASYPRSDAYGVSADGNVVVGWSYNAAGRTEAFRWSGGTMTGLGFLSGGREPFSVAYAVSANGGVVVGLALIWGLDDDGEEADWSEAFRWSGGAMTGLGFLPGASQPDNQPNSQASAVSADGNVVVGWSYNAAGRTEAFRWSGGTMTGLGFLPGGGSSTAHAVSADGGVVVGRAFSAVGGHEVFIWDATHGIRSLKNELLAAGVGGDLVNWHLVYANGISADGWTIVGWGLNPAGQQEAWRAVLPRH